jgi:sulfate adenylyltransferase subunit 2
VSAPAPRVSQLRALEAEAVFVVREVVAELARPVLLFSGGKDSIVLLRVAEKAFRPGFLGCGSRCARTYETSLST